MPISQKRNRRVREAHSIAEVLTPGKYWDQGYELMSAWLQSLYSSAKHDLGREAGFGYEVGPDSVPQVLLGPRLELCNFLI